MSAKTEAKAKPRLTAKVLRGLAIVKGIAWVELEANGIDSNEAPIDNRKDAQDAWAAIHWINAMQLHAEAKKERD